MFPCGMMSHEKTPRRMWETEQGMEMRKNDWDQRRRGGGEDGKWEEGVWRKLCRGIAAWVPTGQISAARWNATRDWKFNVAEVKVKFSSALSAKLWDFLRLLRSYVQWNLFQIIYMELYNMHSNLHQYRPHLKHSLQPDGFINHLFEHKDAQK